MSGFLQGACGLALLWLGWTLPRRIAGARFSDAAAVALDAAPLAVVAAVVLAAGGRPILAGAAAAALGVGFAFADRTVRDTLREPIVFVALSELPQLFTHPLLYLPFAGTGRVLGGAAAIAAAAAALFAIEPAVMAPHPLAALLIAILLAGMLRLIGREPFLGAAAQGLRRLRPSGEPFADAARLGPVAMLIAHGVIARAERPARQARLAPSSLLPAPTIRAQSAPPRPVIVVQCESFFDARRVLPNLPRDFLAGYDACCETYGRLEVPAWGANTTRAEFAVLTGLSEAALGYDRFNPYHALTRAPIASHVWRLREAGYRTICLHPFDRRFFRRDLAMPALGFDEFLGSESLGGSRTPPYAADPELARDILRVLEAEGPAVFIFAITMGNHGPWVGSDPLAERSVGDLIAADVPQRGELVSYLGGLCQTDAMLRALTAGLEQRRSEAVLACYGDHLPSLRPAFRHLGFDDWRSDYAIRAGLGSAPRRRELAAAELGGLIIDMMQTKLPGRRDSVVREAHGA